MRTTFTEPAVTALPPLILHPFADPSGPSKLVESSRASLVMQGLLPSGEQDEADLDRAVLDGRYCEIRMLFYVGKDLTRWIEQCLESVGRHPDLCNRNFRFQSFAEYLIHNTPLSVQNKVRKWGVADYKAIFTRALGLNAVFAEIPSRTILSSEFIRNYYRYADQFYATSLQGSYADLDEKQFSFELYASGEYSRMLEKSWEDVG